MIDEDGRPEPPHTSDERATIEGFLDFHRATLELKCRGLTPEQLATRSVPPSSLSLLGIVRHLTDVERNWFDRFVRETKRPPLFYSEDEPDGDFDNAVGTAAAVEEAFAAWRAAVEESRAASARTALDATFDHPRNGPTSLRWVLTHLVEEYARHNGHADLLRETIDGATGE
ncbi:MAG: hypothetical protein QOC66_1039 [Pseudonocardiales bacterium]|nr:hypothetical protein [Pseudonocardiales bacterium]